MLSGLHSVDIILCNTMKKRYTLLLALLVSVSVTYGQVRTHEIFGGGGNASAPYTHDCIMLANYGQAAVSLANYSL